MVSERSEDIASYPGARRGGAEEERKKERLVSTARACAKCSFILP